LPELKAALAKAGVSTAGNWTYGELYVGWQAIDDLATKLGGYDRAKKFINGAELVREHSPGYAEIRGNKLIFRDDWAGADTNYMRGAIVHELAHYIDGRIRVPDPAGPDGRRNRVRVAPNQAIPSGHNISAYGAQGGGEYFAEAFTDWVYGNKWMPDSAKVNGVPVRSHVTDANNKPVLDFLRQTFGV
jgi:hypothetical protein